MPKGKSSEMKGSICNVPVTEVDVNYNTLPRPADSNGLLIVKLKHMFCKSKKVKYYLKQLDQCSLFNSLNF